MFNDIFQYWAKGLTFSHVLHLMCSLLVGSDSDWSSRIVQKDLSPRQKPAPGCQWDFLWTYYHSLESFFTVRITQSTPMSGENSIALFSIEKVILTYFRLMVWKLRVEMSFRITVETNGNSTQLCQKCKFFCPFGHKLVYAWLWLADKFIQKWRWTLSFWRCWTIQISKNNLKWFLHLFTNVYHAVKFKKKLIFFVLHREFCGFGRWTWIQDMIINYFKWLKNFLWNKV